MKIKEIFNLKNLILIVLLILVALVSILKVSPIASSTEFHKNSIKKLDEKKVTVVKLTTASAIAATAISSIPGDATTPLANQIMNISTYLLYITAVIYLEKVLLTLTGLVAFKYLIPISCTLGILFIICKKEILKIFAFKLSAFGILIFVVVPTSVYMSSWIENNYKDTIQMSIDSAENIKISEEDSSNNEETSEKTGFFKSVVNKVQDAVETVTTGVEQSIERAKAALNNFIDAIAVLIITSCVIPILVLIFFTWLVKMLFGINVNITRPPKIKPFKEKCVDISPKVDEQSI